MFFDELKDRDLKRVLFDLLLLLVRIKAGIGFQYAQLHRIYTYSEVALRCLHNVRLADQPYYYTQRKHSSESAEFQQ